MKSTIASLRSLTLPFGATTGTRLVLDGVAGTISGFDASNNLVFKLDGTDASWGGLPSGARVEIDGDNGVINIYDASNNRVATLSQEGLEVINPLTGGTAVVSPGVEGTPAAPVIEVQTILDSGTTHGTPSATPHGANDLELRWVGLSHESSVDTSNTFTPPATYTERADLKSEVFSNRQSFGTLATKALASSADTGTQNFTSTHDFSGAGDPNSGGIGVTIDVKSREGASAAFRSANTAQPSDGATRVDFTKPSGTAEGDSIIVIFTDADDGTPATFTPEESGWTQLFNGWVVIAVNSTSHTIVWHRIAGASEPSTYGFTSTGSTGNGMGVIAAVQDAESVTVTADVLVDGISVVVPPGAITAFGGATAPSGWLLCNGAAVSRTTFAKLFNIIGTTFGVGDGSTTFNVPDMRQRFPLGKAVSGTGAALGDTGGTIDHVHDLTTGHAKITFTASSPQHRQRRITVPTWTDTVSITTTGAAASSGSNTTGSELGGSSDVANPPFLSLNYIIKI